jgi:SAM-dependent methyltransferase
VEDDLWSPYDEIGEQFARHAEDSAYNAHYDRPAVLAALGPVAGRAVLDAACGPGIYASALLDGGAQVAAFDASQTMVTLAQQRVGPRAEIQLARLGEPLPYGDGVFDLAICALAIHYVADRPAAFAELHRVLRPGGALVVSTHHPTTDWLRKGGSYFDRRLETDVWQSPAGEQRVRFWREPLTDLCAAATSAGFVIELLVEPRPAETMRVDYPDDYEQLNREPGFLVLRLGKRAARAETVGDRRGLWPRRLGPQAGGNRPSSQAPQAEVSSWSTRGSKRWWPSAIGSPKALRPKKR